MSIPNLQDAKDAEVLAKGMRDAAARAVFKMFVEVKEALAGESGIEGPSEGLDAAIGQHALSEAIWRYNKNEYKKARKEYKALHRQLATEMDKREK